jgi:hypothetical protein
MKDLRDEIALGASDADVIAFTYTYNGSRLNRAEARYAYADAMMKAREIKSSPVDDVFGICNKPVGQPKCVECSRGNYQRCVYRIEPIK